MQPLYIPWERFTQEPAACSKKQFNNTILELYRDYGKSGNYYSILGLYRDNGKENGSYCGIYIYILGLYRDNGQEHGDYFLGSRVGGWFLSKATSLVAGLLGLVLSEADTYIYIYIYTYIGVLLGLNGLMEQKIETTFII